MKLKKKYCDLLDNDEGFDNEGLAIECEKIADDFAIGFAEWIRKEPYYEPLTEEFSYKGYRYESEKQLLKIYKQEKGL